MRAGRSWLRWTGPAASGPESRTPGVDCRGGSDCSESNRIESLTFLPNRPSLEFTHQAPGAYLANAVAAAAAEC